MGISQPQNLRAPVIEKQRPYGIRVSLPPGDPFRKILGPEWHRIHWYPTPDERDAALAEMSRRHQYSRARRQAVAGLRQDREPGRKPRTRLIGQARPEAV